MARLVALDGRGELSSGHVRLAASAAGVSERTVWNWLAVARREGRLGRRARAGFVVTPKVRALLALWGGNVSAVHRELVARAGGEGDRGGVPSLSALHRAVVRDVPAGERAGWKGGEVAARAFDVYGRRPARWRNACWEGDHKRVPVRVGVEGEALCPWITWFIDCATKVICGVAVTPHPPSRDGVLAALRAGLGGEFSYGPAYGLPSLVRVDRGKEFLCATVTRALGAFAVPVHPLPAYTPHLKGTIEQLNDAVEEMLLVSLPGYTRRARPADGRAAAAGEERLLTFEAFVGVLLEWVGWWNAEHHPAGLPGGVTPAQAWEADPTPVEEVVQGALVFFALEDDGRTRKVTTGGVRWRCRAYIAPWMVGRVGMPVRLRFLPHDDSCIEVFDAGEPSRHLGTAYLAEQATPQQRAALRAARTARAAALKADLKAAEKLRRTRYAAATVPAPPRPRHVVTRAEAQAELSALAAADLASRALPDLIPPREPPASWARPVRRPEPGTGHGLDADRADAPVVPGPPAPAPEAFHTDKDTNR
ncbi:Mu transposase C-terminal domain-containing protein [Actinacidiphila bryophytorum]|uniref:Mu transposase C-terminal domain-containing protein n=1 Tax=Actinacidiphila bryophytorum TaxID=1436133 RepID=UPI0022486CCD|nr:Mu transposase C-terminal domain-containing protein [Actinacidiphila bryophytorum]